MAVAALGTTSSLRFLCDLDWNCWVVLYYEGQDSFVLFCFVGGGLVSFLEISLLRVRC